MTRRSTTRRGSARLHVNPAWQAQRRKIRDLKASSQAVRSRAAGLPPGQPRKAVVDLPLIIVKVGWGLGASLPYYCDPTLKGQAVHLASAEAAAGVELDPMIDGLPREPLARL
jgi:hypothetical protein